MVAATAVDLRDETDEDGNNNAITRTTTKGGRASVSLAKSPLPMDGKAKFLIRTLPRDCNPTPVTAAPGPTVALLSPRGRKASTASDDAFVNISSTQVFEDTESENPFDDITEEKLQRLTGKEDLARVTSVQLSVDSAKQSLEIIGELLPSLQQLRLLNSTLQSFRDLGTSLHSLQTLWVAHCGIKDLDGIGALTGLQELYIQHNEVADISPLTMHDELQVIDLEANKIADVGQIEQLAFCPQLRTLNLAANPVCGIQHYRQIVVNFVPQLIALDKTDIQAHERQRLPDEIIDASIATLEDELQRQAEIDSAAGIGPRPSTSHGRWASSDSPPSPQKLARTGSSARMATVGDAAPTLHDCYRDDYGSTLTHGTDIVFAGNVTSALRRHRSETESDSPSSPKRSSQMPNQVASSPKKASTLERPQTPASRESITATLDRAHELETSKHKSRDAILQELRAWQLETAGASQTGVVSLDESNNSTTISPSASPLKRSTNDTNAKSNAVRRPQTSAGVLRNGLSVREAFIETTRHATPTRTSERPSSRGGSSEPPSMPLKRHSASSTSTVPAPKQVDILILDDHHATDDSRPCSPRKTARGVFTTSTVANGEWNLEDLTPTIDVKAADSFLKRRGNEGDDQDEGSSDSDADDMRSVARQLKQRKPSRSVLRKTKIKGFFNVSESLHAIDRWREQMDDENGPATSESGRPPTPSTPKTPVATDPSSRGPACDASDEQLVQWMKEKHKIVADIKTRDGFRRFFRGITEERLTQILHQVFSDPEKVRRRLQLMQGHFDGQQR